MTGRAGKIARNSAYSSSGESRLSLLLVDKTFPGVVMMTMSNGKMHFALYAAIVAALPGCGGSLDTLDGPLSGSVAGLVCIDVSTLEAAAEVPAVADSLVAAGKCLQLRSPAKVDFLRTVMMPGDGKYSQFEYHQGSKTVKLWISTAKVKGGKPKS